MYFKFALHVWRITRFSNPALSLGLALREQSAQTHTFALFFFVTPKESPCVRVRACEWPLLLSIWKLIQLTREQAKKPAAPDQGRAYVYHKPIHSQTQLTSTVSVSLPHFFLFFSSIQKYLPLKPAPNHTTRESLRVYFNSTIIITVLIITFVILLFSMVSDVLLNMSIFCKC